MPAGLNMYKRNAIIKSVIQFIAGIFLLVVVPCSEAIAEPMEGAVTKDSINKLIAQINTSKPDEHRVDNLFTIARYFLFNGRKECKGYIDSAFSLSEKLSYNNGLVKTMCLKAVLLSRKDSTSANKFLENAIALSRKEKRPDLEGYVYYIKGIYFSKGDAKIAEQYYTKARILYNASGNQVNEAYILKCIADTHILQNMSGQALNELFEALNIYRKAGHPSLHYTYDLIGIIYNQVANHEEALKYGLLAIKSALQTKDTADIGLFYLRVGLIFMELIQPMDALPYFLKVQKKAEEEGGTFTYQRAAASNISDILIITGKPAEALRFYQKAIAVNPANPGSLKYSRDERTLGDIYFSLKQFDQAEKHYLRMLECTDKTYFVNYFNLTGCIRLGEFYFTQGKFAKARDYLNKAVLNNSLKSLADSADLNFQQYKVDSAYGNYLSAIRHYQIYKSLNDSLFNEKKSKQIAGLNIQYETEKKEQIIGTLTAQNSEQKVILEKRSFQRNVFTAGAIMLLLLLLLSVNRYRIKQRANRQLQEQQEVINKKNEALKCVLEEKDGLLLEKESLIKSKDKLIIEKEWLVKEVHHRVKNNLQMISTLLYSQASYLRDTVAIAAINESQQRIHAISLIHQKLYQSDNLQLVNMQSYIHELVDYLKESFDNVQEIEFDLKIDSFEIGLAKAIPLGLILNEAITNSMKYAFCKDSRKIVSIQLQRSEDCSILLQIKDNGKGIPADFNPDESDTLGINLMHGLSNQIHAVFSMKNENGTVISLQFPENDEASSEQLI
jgi:two-component system, sensor histidine kinase PdtaS